MTTPTLPSLWNKCVDLLKDRVNNRSFWEAIENTVPVTVEQNTLIIGLDPYKFNMATHIQQTYVLHTVETTIAQVFGQPLKVRVIEGTTVADWEMVKQRDERAAIMKQSMPVVSQRPVEAADTASWDALIDFVARLYSQFPVRTLPQGRARYANEALYTVAEAMDNLYTEPATEGMERGLARILDRIAVNSDIPAPVLAFELERLRAWRKATVEPEAE